MSKQWFDERLYEMKQDRDRLAAENENLRKQHTEAHTCTANVFSALVMISMITGMGGEVAEYEDVVDSVKRLAAENAELVEALEAIGKGVGLSNSMLALNTRQIVEEALMKNLKESA